MARCTPLVSSWHSSHADAYRPRSSLQAKGPLVRYIVAQVLVILALLGVVAGCAHARPVSLSDALSPPTELVFLYPHASVTYAYGREGYNCPREGRYFSDVSAYNWRGDAIGAQRWNRDHTVTYWRNRTGRVTFDGITFRNDSRQFVLVAGWCDYGD